MEPEATRQDKTPSRKREHVELCVNGNVAFRQKSAGFERVEFLHNAVPELDFKDITTETTFLGKSAALPLMISSMTGGYTEAERINAQLAEVCNDLDIPMGVGSQRQALENTEYHNSFRVVRQAAPHIAVCANIGAAELAGNPSPARMQLIIDLVEADALIVHLNPLQELLQPEGTPNFKGLLHAIETLRKTLNIPIIAKEVGAGISAAAARRLLDAGVNIIDVAGAGGTSWAGVEILRRSNPALVDAFWDWGIPTVDCLLSMREVRREYRCGLIASGGIRSGLDVAKALALGADMVAAARVFIKTLLAGGAEALNLQIREWQYQLQCVMFLSGAATVHDLPGTDFRLHPAQPAQPTA